MTDYSPYSPPPPGGPASHTAVAGPAIPPPGRALLAAVAIIAGSAVLGLAAGAIWSAIAPRVVYQMASLNPPTAFATNPETSAFIGADGWYCVIALIGGALIGLLGYVFAVRPYGPLPMAAVVVGATAAAFVAMWAGKSLSGAGGFNSKLAHSKIDALLRAPISLGSHGAIAFWPFAAAAVAGGFELISVLHARQRARFSGSG